MSQLVLNTSVLQTTSSDSSSSSPGDVLDFYAPTGEILGKGSFGVVERGQSRKTGSPVAIKTQARSLIAKTEAFALKNIKAAHLVCCREVFEDPADKTFPKLHIVMDFVPEKNIGKAFLDPLNPDKRLTFKETVCITHQILEFLSDLIKQQIVYFDLKPENLIFNRASRSLTVIDGGGVRHPSFDTVIKFTTTPGYRSPEFILKSHFGSSYDCWSLACTIYRIVTDKYLFFVPSGIPPREINNYLLQLIVQQLGEPTPEYLNQFNKAAEFFGEGMKFQRDLHVPQSKKWDVSIREAAFAKNWPTDEVEQLIDLMRKMLRYENRATAEQLLQHPLFSKETVVDLLHDHQKTGTLFIQRASTISVSLRHLTLEQITPLDFVLPFNQPIPTCLHLPKDPEGKYIVILEKNKTFVKERFFFRDKHVLDIRELQKRVSTMDPLVSSSSFSLPSVSLQVSTPSSTPPSTPARVPSAKRQLSFSSRENATDSEAFKKIKKD